VVVIWRDPADEALRASLEALATLFADDTGSAESAALCRVLELPRDAAYLRQIAEASCAPAADAAPPARARTRLDLPAVAALEAALAQADLGRFLRRRAVYAPDPDGGFRLRWEQRVLALDELLEALLPRPAEADDPTLLHRLGRTLERRVLATLAQPQGLRGAEPFGLNLSPEGILAAEFLRFDAALPAALRGRITLALHPAELLADLPTFLFAREFARIRRYRLALREVGVELLPVLPLAGLELDLLQLRWSPALAEADPPLAGAAPAQVVLTGADEPAAIAWGRLRGIALFEGRAAVRPASADTRQEASSHPGAPRNRRR
jgi:hypothetical protein